MARVHDIDSRTPAKISEGWQLASTAAGAIGCPQDLPLDLAWIPAQVPGTVAAASAAAGIWKPAAPHPLNDKDHWYRTRFHAEGSATLRFHGLATIATVWLNGIRILSSRSMFVTHDVPVELNSSNELVICFHSLANALSEPTPAGRWRPRMITPSSLRNVRTTCLGHMPGWCPNIDTVGPWRAIELLTQADTNLHADVIARAEGSKGLLDVVVHGYEARGTPVLACAGFEVPCSIERDGTIRAHLELPGVPLWWPHTHGEPALHDVTLHADGTRINLGRTGFRSISVDTGCDAQGFGLIVNGEPIFSRGAVWASAGLMHMPSAASSIRPWLERARDAGFNMLRVPGTTVYEADAFYEICDELGLMIWQDFMFANFDYPASDGAFMKAVETEAHQFLSRTQSSPCLAALCGGSEVYQQAAMLGLPARKYVNPIFETLLKDISHARRLDVPFVVNSPSGGPVPFSVDKGVSHYFGVGGYRLPMDDARRAGVRFASECLAFANVPAAMAASQHEPPLDTPGDARWKARVPRDAGSPWDFEDVRDHYMEQLFGVHAVALRATDPERYLELGRATQAHVMEQTFCEWLRPASATRGALVLMLQDLETGPGWGLLGADTEPKSAWYALKRIFTPLRVTVTDEGVNGLDVHVTNETQGRRALELQLSALRHGRTRVLNAKHDLELAPRAAKTLNAYEIIGSFFDISYSYRFQAPQHDTTVVMLLDKESGDVLSEAFHFPCGLAVAAEGALKARIEEHDGQWWLNLEAEKVARFVHIVDQNFRAEDDWFHLSPLRPRRIRLIPRTCHARPNGHVLALNMTSPVAYEAPK